MSRSFLDRIGHSKRHRRMVKNSAGGRSFAMSRWDRLDRFLILGSEQSTFYASARSHAVQNFKVLKDCVASDGLRTVKVVERVSSQGRAPRNDAAIIALAWCLKHGDVWTRQAAAQAVPRVCRTGTHLFQLAQAVDHFGGWGRLTRGAFASWYAREDLSSLAWQVVKYQARHGWSHRNLLRKTHVSPPSAAHDALFGWVCGGEAALEEAGLTLLAAAEAAKVATSDSEIVALIESAGLPREAIPTRFLTSVAVWEALLLAGRGMPMTAMIRNLGKMSSMRLFEASSACRQAVIRRLEDPEQVRKARIHPLAVLVALETYKRGKGVKGSLRWVPEARILDALDRAFNHAFGNIEATGKRWMLGLDVSGSMGWGEVAGMTGISPRVGAGAMAMATARTESDYRICAFSHRLVPVDLSARMRLDTVLSTLDAVPMGGTDCALPMVHATKARLEVDTFVVYTDSETWYGKVTPVEALKRYRQAMGIDAKLIVVGMLSNGFTIADPKDRGMLDVVGFDTAAPGVMAHFAQA